MDSLPSLSLPKQTHKEKPLLPCIGPISALLALWAISNVGQPSETRASVMIQPRRAVALGLGTVCSDAYCRQPSAAAGPARIKSFRQVIAEDGLDDWKIKDYEMMRDDAPRTSGFEAAIRRKLTGSEGQAVVVDIGTGPFALLAVMAARAGAKRVYAIEINPDAAAMAKKTVQELGLQSTVKVIEGDSTQVELPEKADLVVSELIGSIATQEGVEPVIIDARERILKKDLGGRSGMIPARCQTCIAPINYRPKNFWSKIINFRQQGVRSRGQPKPGTDVPLRIPASDVDKLLLLAPPQIMEEFKYDGGTSRTTSPLAEDRQLLFHVSAELPEAERRFSGFALWTRVVIDESAILDVREQPDSHWAYVVALMAKEPVQLALPGEVRLRSRADKTARPARYTFEAEVTAM